MNWLRILGVTALGGPRGYIKLSTHVFIFRLVLLILRLPPHTSTTTTKELFALIAKVTTLTFLYSIWFKSNFVLHSSFLLLLSLQLLLYRLKRLSEIKLTGMFLCRDWCLILFFWDQMPSVRNQLAQEPGPRPNEAKPTQQWPVPIMMARDRLEAIPTQAGRSRCGRIRGYTFNYHLWLYH